MERKHFPLNENSQVAYLTEALRSHFWCAAVAILLKKNEFCALSDHHKF